MRKDDHERCGECGRRVRTRTRYARKFFIRDSSATGNGHPMLFSFKPAELFGPFTDPGGYPIGFLERAFDLMGVTDPDRVLHVCSGSVRRGVTIDIRRTTGPRIVGDGERLPLRAASFRWILIDPPYSEDLARDLYSTSYPTPARLVAEAARVVTSGGYVGFLHTMTPPTPPGLRLLGVWGITTGAQYHIRAFSLFRKDETLFP